MEGYHGTDWFCADGWWKKDFVVKGKAVAKYLYVADF